MRPSILIRRGLLAIASLALDGPYIEDKDNPDFHPLCPRDAALAYHSATCCHFQRKTVGQFDGRVLKAYERLRPISGSTEASRINLKNVKTLGIETHRRVTATEALRQPCF